MGSERSFLLLLVALWLGAFAAPGCTSLEGALEFKKQVAEAETKVRIYGTVESDAPVTGTLVVVVGTPEIGPDGSPVVGSDGLPRHRGVDSYSRAEPGSFLFVLDPGSYQVGAYEDCNENGVLDTGERVSLLNDNDLLVLAPGDRATVEIRLQAERSWQRSSVDILDLVEKDAHEQGRFALWAFSAKGNVAPHLSDPRFGAKQGLFGLWQPVDFVHRELAGIYFLEGYDPDRVPVLYVHGIEGYPQQFTQLIGSLDRRRFQAWFYFYPSGFSLDGLATHLADVLREVQIQTGFDEIGIVAHSMGGLVSRGAILKYAEQTGRYDIAIFISIDSPFGGDVRAKSSENAPIALPASFKDMAPSSEYLTWLYYQDPDRKIFKPLPEPARHHMIIGYGGSGSPYNDGTVTVASQAQVDLQEHAASIRIWEFDHMETLSEERTLDRVNRLLAETF